MIAKLNISYLLEQKKVQPITKFHFYQFQIKRNIGNISLTSRAQFTANLILEDT